MWVSERKSYGSDQIPVHFTEPQTRYSVSKRRAYGNVIRNAYAADRILLWVGTLMAVFRLARFVEVVESDRSTFCQAIYLSTLAPAFAAFANYGLILICNFDSNRVNWRANVCEYPASVYFSFLFE